MTESDRKYYGKWIREEFEKPVNDINFQMKYGQLMLNKLKELQ